MNAGQDRQRSTPPAPAAPPREASGWSSGTRATHDEQFSRPDERAYERGGKVSDTQLAAVNLTCDEFRPERSYVSHPSDRSGVV